MQVRQYVVFPAPNRVFLDVAGVVASARTTAAVTSRPAPTRAARQARSVAPVVTTSSTRITAARAGGNCPGVDAEPPGQVRDARRGVQPDRVARPPTQPQRRRHPQPRRRRGPGAGTAGARGHRRGRALRPAGTARAPARPGAEPAGPARAAGTSSAASGPARSRRPRSLYASTRRAQRPAVPAGRHDRRPAGQHRPSERPEPGGAAGAPPRPGRGAAAAGAGQEKVEQGGEQNAGRQRRRGVRGGRHAASVPDRHDGTRPTTAGTAELSTGRGRRPQARAAAVGRAVSRGRAAPRPGRRPPAGATTPGPRRRSSTPRTGPSPARGGSARRRPHAAAA